MLNKKSLTEADIRTKFITPAIEQVGWDKITQFREEVYFTDGRIIVRGKLVMRGKRKRADYILYYKPNIPIAIIEAKDNNHNIGDGLQQAIEYGEILDIPFIYSSNGDGFIEHDKTKSEGKIEVELSLDNFPTPQDLWNRYKEWKGISSEFEKPILQQYFYERDGKVPRYYQRVAINRTVEAIIKGQNRILLVMATGTGKTFTVFQIIWRLWKAGIKKRILFLADRNILIDQARTNDFKPFGDKITKVKHRHIDKSYEIYLALYQGLSGNEDWQNIYKQFSSDFFDLVIIDECHRGSARVDSAWREILKYFSSATQIGMTATPRETKDISNIEYFEEPIYIYSLKQGIEDGFLAPYKVIRVGIDRDLEGYRPPEGKIDKYGFEVADREYNISDYDRNLVIDKRTELVAKRVSDYLKNNNSRFDKTILFCVDIEHATRMRQALINENSDLVKKHNKYVMKITGDDQIGKMELDNFIDPASRFPTLVTTSKLLNTGVDAQTCKLIVLDTNINSMTEFKQIIGRGTRIREDYDKLYFTIIDFRKATRLFADKDFDGDPVKIKEIPSEVDIPVEEDEIKTEDGVLIEDEEIIFGDVLKDLDEEGITKPRKYYLDDVDAKIILERELYYDKDGKLITESLVDYSKKNIKQNYASLNDFLIKWKQAEKKEAIIDELREQGLHIDGLQNEVGKEFDPFDLICHVAFDMKPLSRRERANNVKKRNYFAKYGEQARAVLNAMLDKYADEGIKNIENMKILYVNPFNEIGNPLELINSFGGKGQYLKAVSELEKQIYAI